MVGLVMVAGNRGWLAERDSVAVSSTSPDDSNALPDQPHGSTMSSGSSLAKSAVFFPSPDAFRAWLREHHQGATELQVGFHKKHTGKPSMTWPESVAEALCYGWIDGIRRTIDEERYVIRFTPRRKGSVWSAINVRLVAELEAAGRMTAAGRAAFDARPKTKGYSYERRDAALDAKRAATFRKNRAAWKFFDAQPPGYKRTLSWWVMSAKREEVRDRRLARLMQVSAEGKRML
jgi:uncharacterized protein YdeI (YjbR/CyaY-like superfamily)